MKDSIYTANYEFDKHYGNITIPTYWKKKKKSQDCKVAVRLVNHIGMASFSRPHDQPVFLTAKYTFHIRKIYLNMFIIFVTKLK